MIRIKFGVQKIFKLKKMRRVYFIIILLLFLSACKTVAPYERMYLNDEEMQLEGNSIDNYESYVHTIREGTTPSNTTKSSGGCGCN